MRSPRLEEWAPPTEITPTSSLSFLLFSRMLKAKVFFSGRATNSRLRVMISGETKAAPVDAGMGTMGELVDADESRRWENLCGTRRTFWCFGIGTPANYSTLTRHVDSTGKFTHFHFLKIKNDPTVISADQRSKKNLHCTSGSAQFRKKINKFKKFKHTFVLD